MARTASRVLLLICFSTGLNCLATATPANHSVNGVWQATIRLDGQENRIILHIETRPNGLSAATLDSPDTGKLGISLQSVKSNKNSLTFELNDPKISFKGKLSADQASLTGDWKQDDQNISITLVRLKQAPNFDKDGPYLFQTRCASCHTPFNAVRAPWPTTLKFMMQPVILAALESGKMRAQGEGMSHEQRIALSSYLGQAESSKETGQANMCATDSLPMAILLCGMDGESIFRTVASSRPNTPA